jgi:hypothetical protein
MALEYFPFYYSYRKKLAKLSDQEVGRLVRSLLEYGEVGETEELTGRESVAFDFIADDIDRAKAQYNQKCEKSKKSIEARYERIRTNTDVFECKETKTKTETKTKPKAKEKEIESNNKRFTPPTLAEIADYCRERGNEVDPKRFFDYFEANNWVDSKGQKVKSWKQKVISWEGRNGNTPKRGRNDALLESIKRDMYDTSRCEGLYIPDESALVEL